MVGVQIMKGFLNTKGRMELCFVSKSKGFLSKVWPLLSLAVSGAGCGFSFLLLRSEIPRCLAEDGAPMSKKWGKIIGGVLGLAAGGPWGGLLGVAIGHAYDRAEIRPLRGEDPWADLSTSTRDFSGNMLQATFTMGVIVLGAKMAKVDGRVTRQEIDAFKRVFQVTPAQEDKIAHLFNRARQSAEGFEPYAFQLAHVFRGEPEVLEEVLSGLFIIASADNGFLNAAELHFLERVAVIFGFDDADFIRIAARSGVRIARPKNGGGGTTASAAPNDAMAEAYAVLGVTLETPADQIKAAYRGLIRTHHPDKLVASGMSPAFIANATEKMKRINAAYDVISKARGIK